MDSAYRLSHDKPTQTEGEVEANVLLSLKVTDYFRAKIDFKMVLVVGFEPTTTCM